jgi:hypothetical protein
MEGMHILLNNTLSDAFQDTLHYKYIQIKVQVKSIKQRQNT